MKQLGVKCWHIKSMWFQCFISSGTGREGQEEIKVHVQVCCRKITGVLYCFNTISLALVFYYVISVKILKEKCRHYD